MAPVPLVSRLALALCLFGAGAAAAASPSRPAQSPPAAGGASFPLARATPDEVKAWLGEPAVANDEAKGAFWTYRLEDCALMVFFKDQGAGLRVSGVATGPRRRSDMNPDPEACIANAKR
jgi:hypothetical protein